MFIFVYGLIGLIGFFSSSAFKYLHTLPITKKKIQVIAYLTYFRLINWQLGAIFIGFPVASGIGAFISGTTLPNLIILVGISTILSFVNIIFLFSLMLTVSLFIAKKVYKPTSSSKLQTVMQIFVSLMYAVVSLGASLAIYYMVPAIQSGIFQINSDLFSIYSNFILYPFGLTHLHSILMIGFIKGWNFIPPITIWISVVAFMLLASITYLLFRRSLRILSMLVKEETYASKRKSTEEIKINLDISKPIPAIFKKDMKFIFRNFSSTLYFLFPILMPLVILLQQIGTVSGGGFSSFWEIIIFAFLYSGMILSFAIMCVTAPESESSGLLYILPAKMRDIYRVKRRIMFFSLSLSSIAPGLILIIKAIKNQFSESADYLWPAIIVTISYLVIYFYGTELALTLYSRFFGKMRNKYTIQMLNVKRKFIKVALGVIILYVVSYIPIILGLLIGSLFGMSALYGSLGMLSTSLVLFGVIRWIAYINFNSH
jgi:hypothetical protein